MSKLAYDIAFRTRASSHPSRFQEMHGHLPIISTFFLIMLKFWIHKYKYNAVSVCLDL